MASAKCGCDASSSEVYASGSALNVDAQNILRLPGADKLVNLVDVETTTV
jgi:hypothetical protein